MTKQIKILLKNSEANNYLTSFHCLNTKCEEIHVVVSKYQPSDAGGTLSPPAIQKWSLGCPKGVYP